MKQFFTTIALATVLTAVTAPVTTAAEDVETLLKKMADKAAAYTSWTSDYVQSMSMMGSTMEVTGRIMFRHPQEMRMEMKMPEMGHGSGNMVMILSGDGIMWQDMKMGEHRQVMKIDTKQMPQGMGKGMNSNPAEQMDPRKQMEAMQQNFDLAIIEGQEVAGQKMHVLEGAVKNDSTDPSAMQMSKMFGKMRMYIGEADGFLHKIEMFAKDNATVAMTQEFKNIQFNVDLADDLFQFTPPEGVQVIDMSKMMQQMKQRPAPGKPDELPPGHPPVKQDELPPGHPPID